MSTAIPAPSNLRATEQARAQPFVQAATPERAPFRWTRRDAHELPVHTRGAVPAWLAGQLVRTAPAVFEQNGWRAQHWFDGLGLIYGFTFAAGRVDFRQCQLASHDAALAVEGRAATVTYGTPTRNNFFRRLVQPIPPVTDNTQVNIVPWQGAWLAMTESEHQHVIDASDLATRGTYKYQDDLARMLVLSAHPHFDFERGALVNIGIRFGMKSEFCVLRQNPSEQTRTLEGKLAFKRMPYLHDFGVTARHVVVIDHPLRMNPASLLFSNRPLIEHFKWEPETGTKLWKFERATARWTAYETEALFCFHVVNTFEEGDDVVFDFIAFDDAKVAQTPLTEGFMAGTLPAHGRRYVRARLRPGATRVELEQLSSQSFELPAIAYRREHGKPYHVAWGASLNPGANGWDSRVVRVDNTRGDVQSFGESGVTYGEPVFVPRPHASSAHDGVILSVGTHRHEDRASLAVLDAGSLSPLAHCDVELALPLGFHGNFQARG